MYEKGKFVQKGYENENFFYFLQQFIQKLTWILLRQSLPTHIQENADFLRQKPWQLWDTKANFKGCSAFLLLQDLTC